MKALILTLFLSCSIIPVFYNNVFEKDLKHAIMIKLIPVRGSLFCMEGQGGNIGIQISKEEILLVDDQFEHMYNSIRIELNKISRAPVKYVINTHWHVDHSNGNEKFGSLGSTIIAQENSTKRMMSKQYIKVFNHHQKAYKKNGVPKISFDSKMNLSFNDQKINLISIKNAHTDGDLIVHFIDENVIHTGDIYVTYGYPVIDEPNGGTIQGMIKAIDVILALCNKETVIIPGHGELSNVDDVKQYKRMLEIIYNRIQFEFEKGKNISQILETKPTRGFYSDKINESIMTEIVVNNLKSRLLE
jgi:glyoxylase-like metal-dependent hydrolase (beta-lactamase superfamily II)